MTIYYVGPGGLDTNAGTSWALRKLTLNGAEDKPVVAGDTVYVAPGVYREILTLDVNGSAGLPITYIGDVTGEHTDGVGGPVRITGSDNDQTYVRANAITTGIRIYRTFRGFCFDFYNNIVISFSTTGANSNIIIEDCYFAPCASLLYNIVFQGTGTNCIIRRCVFLGGRQGFINFTHTAVVNSAGHLIENCLFIGSMSQAINSGRVGGITVRNCTFFGCATCIRVTTALTTGQTITVNNCLLIMYQTGFTAVTLPATNEEITENYNTLIMGVTDRSQVTAGANSNTFVPSFEMPIMLDGFHYPWNSFSLSQWAAQRRLAGTNMSAEDIYGITGPITAAKNSWGAVQYQDLTREITTKRTGNASIKIADAGVHQMFVLTSATSTVFSCYVQWEADYAGTLPQMIIKQPGRADTTVTATGSSGTWVLLTTTLTPNASPGYCMVEFRSNNTATATNFDVFFDDFSAT